MTYEKVEGENAIRILSKLALKYLDEEMLLRPENRGIPTTYIHWTWFQEFYTELTSK